MIRHAFFFFLLLTIRVYGQKDSTLGDVLTQNSVSFRSNSVSHLGDPISSYTVLGTDREFLIAYYLTSPQNELRFPLFLARLNKRTGKWDERALTDLKVKFSAGSKQENHHECLGSAMRLENRNGWYHLDLHLTPSAGCLVVLNRGLTVHRILTGGSAGLFNSGLLVYERNMVHFATVHAATLLLYDPATGRSQQIYPLENDPFRKNFSNRLAGVINTETCLCHAQPSLTDARPALLQS
jgi:hypothetical protein